MSYLKSVVRFVMAVWLLSTRTVTPAAPAPFLYIVNQGANSVSVIDTMTGEVKATIPVGDMPYGVAISQDGTRAYVANIAASSNSVSVIDTDPSSPTYNNELCRIPVGGNPIGVAVTPDGSRVYVAQLGSSDVAVIDAASCAVMSPTIPVGAPSAAGGIAITPDGTRAFVATGFFSGTVAVIDTDPTSPTYNTVLTTIQVGAFPAGVAITPDGTRAYVTNGGSNSVSVIDTASNTVIITIPMAGGPFGVAITPDGTRAYVTQDLANTVSVIDTASNTVMMDTIPVEDTPVAVAITPDGTFAYVANNESNPNHVSKIDTDPKSPTYNTVVTTILVDGHPWGVAVTPF
jgi:YVTN family beta-propeller protein